MSQHQARSRSPQDPPRRSSPQSSAEVGVTRTSQFARDVGGEEGPTDRLQRGVELAVELIRGCDHAGVTVIDKTGARTDAATDDVVWRGDQLQYDLDEGPCLEAVASQGSVVSNDIGTDSRWQRWGPTVARELGVGSMMSLLLYVDHHRDQRLDQPTDRTSDRSVGRRNGGPERHATIGALNLYGDGPDSFDSNDLAVAQALAAHLALAVADSREIEQRGTAMINRTMIGQAEGILMERYTIDAERDFGVLRRLSQDTNRKLVSIAEELVTTRHLPDGDKTV